MSYIEIERELEKYRNCIEGFMTLLKKHKELYCDLDRIIGNEETVKNAKEEIVAMSIKVEEIICALEKGIKKTEDILIPPQPPVFD